ncbi:MAG: DUF104 domain-containing protein [Xenococcaceae cyanobacterium MO_188.B19]|nr:DUF104 domain-containing protein [Xenococcaceae cyanobacterium MO_188.B19]MDJ0680186.1 DUF104 domain-containing protein [Xenococcaceae cyanobacterium MO_167.B52]
MLTIKGTVRNGVIYPLESINLPEGQSVMIVLMEENQAKKSIQSQPKLSQLLLLPELEEDDSFFERNKDTGREIDF